MNGKSLELATKVSSGQKLTMSFNDVQEILGFKRNGDTRLYRETLDKYTTAFDYLSTQRNVANQITGYLKENTWRSKWSRAPI